MTETVWVRTRSSGGWPATLHSDPDCPRLQTALSVRQYDRDAFPPDVSVCSVCEADQPPHGTGTPSDAFRTLDRADPDTLPLGGGA